MLGASLAVGCGSPIRLVRTHLAEGDLDGAIDLAGRDRRSLEAVALEVLRRGLDDRETRRAAAGALRSAGSLARDALDEYVASTDDMVAKALALEALARLGSRSARAQLEPLTRDERPEIRATAIRALAPFTSERERFEAWLADEAEVVRVEAVAAVASRDPGPWAIRALIEMARNDAAWTVRAAAMRVLPRLTRGDDLIAAAAEVLERADNPATARLAAIDALGRAESLQSAESLLLSCLEGGGPAERVHTAAILASYGDLSGHEHLREALASRNVLEAREAAIASGRVGGPLVDALLVALRRPEPELRLHVAEALLRAGEREVAVAALEALMDEGGWIGLQAALALARGRVRSSGAAIRLAAALEDEAPEIRRYAAFSCGALEFGLELAAGALADESPEVRVAAAGAVLQHFHRADLQRGRRSVMIPPGSGR